MNMYMVNFILNYLLLILMVLVGVSFVTLLERKVLGYIQLRKGPNKVGIMGVFQPFSDGIKLFSNEFILIGKSNFLYFYLSPIFTFFFSLMFWLIYPYYFNLISFELGVLMFFCVLSLGVYPMMIAGWSSNSVYSLLGSLRSVAQTISYEVSLILIMLNMIMLVESLNFKFFYFYQKYIMFIFIMFPLSLILFVSFLAELNRTPYDFSEGESELVSGFNIEYMSGGFALIFLGEYSNIIYLSMIFILMNFGGMSLLFYFFWMFMIFLIIWVRGTLPRFRYDKLMYMVWLNYLPVSLNYLIFILLFKYYLFNYI